MTMAFTKGLPKPPLTERMRNYTREIHDESDKIINYKLIVTFADRELYGKAISYFYIIYKTLEVLIEEHKEHESIQKIYPFLPIIGRSEGFEADLKFFLGNDWRSKSMDPPQAVVEYVTHLNEVAKTDPNLLLSYVYHMYMAIFAGGFLIKRMARKAMSLPRDKGTELFELKGGINPGTLRKQLKDAINSLNIQEEDIKKLLQESHYCFQQNNRIAGSIEGVSDVFFEKLMKVLFVISILVVALSLLHQYNIKTLT